MKATHTKWYYWLGAIIMTALAVSLRADNNCMENPTTNQTCLIQGTLAPGFVLAPTNITATIGQSITPPLAYNLSITNSLESNIVTYLCTPEIIDIQTNPIPYTFGGLNFVPSIPSVFWTPGTYAYTANVIALGSPCSPLTNLLGTVTVTIATNIPDVLLDVDFGIGPISAMKGYAEIGDSAADFWNECTNSPSGILLSNLVTANGIVSPVGMLVTGLSVTGMNGSSDAMYHDYLSTNATVATVTITNLPAGTWNIFLYSDDGNFGLTVTDTNNNTIANYGPQTSHDISPSLTPLAWQQGVQYVLFTNVIVGSGQTLSVSINPGTNGAGVISGMQIASAYHLAPAGPPPSGMVAWWPANGNAEEIIGGTTGTVYAATTYTNGMVKQAFDFDGVSGCVMNSNTPPMRQLAEPT